MLDWDGAKREANVEKHGLDFALVEQFEWQRALVRADVRFGYGEVRLIAIGPIAGEPDRLFTVVFTVERRAVRIISFRRASNREIRSYNRDEENQA